MNNDRIRRVLREMEQAGIPQMIVSDPVAIYYLTGRKIFSGERLLALYLQVNGGHKLVINELFPQSAEPDGQLELVWYSDTQDGVELLHQFADKASPMGIDKNWPARFPLRLQELGGGSAYVNGSPIIDRVRMIKDQEEQEKMRRSSQINDQVMAELLTWVGKGLTEEEMAEKAKAIYRAHGCEGLSFPPIVSYGRGAAEPHHEPGDARAKRGDCVLLDIGGMKDGYASDMTRTVFLGEVSPRQREIYEIVREACQRGINAARPGNRMCDVDLAARRYIEERGYGAYFTHRTGHSIGLEDHEYGDVSAVNQAVIQPGQCFSVEPGIYLPEEDLGVRIEDLVLITEDGCQVLNQFTKELLVIPMEEN